MSASTVEDVLAGRARWCVAEGDNVTMLRSMPDSVIDAVVSDPPSGIAFMNAEWDKDKGGRDEWIAWMQERAAEMLRVCKPGAHALVWALPRTSHWTATAFENAGWEVRDRIAHIFATGYPKSLAIDKAIDRHNGDTRPVHGTERRKNAPSGLVAVGRESETIDRQLTSAASAASAAWAGWGTSIKPSVEDWWLLRKPLIGTVAANVLAHGTGGLNIDGCRIGYSNDEDMAAAAAAALLRAFAHVQPPTSAPEIR